MNDEEYIVSLCNIVLERLASTQHRFCFLRGDKAIRQNGEIIEVLQEQGRKLPVDAYYRELNLVIEYLEIQHFHPVPLFDNRITCSNVPRGEQRQIYDNRRRVRIPENGICLIELHYTDFNHHANTGSLIRNEALDKLVIRRKLSQFLRN